MTESLAALKPCPFCGGEAELYGHHAPEFWVVCPKIGCKASTEGFSGKERAIAAWDTRAADQRCAELEAEVARLREASIALRDDLLMRAEIDRRDGTKIVDASNGVWMRFNKALDNRDD